jgi:hypothetical protein
MMHRLNKEGVRGVRVEEDNDDESHLQVPDQH